MIDVSFIIGLVGMLCILVAFVLDEFWKKFNQETVQYNVLNIIGAGMLVYYGFVISGWPFVVLNVVWCVAACVKLGRVVLKKGKRR